MPAIKDWLVQAKIKLKEAEISTYNLDAEIILAFCLNENRTYLHSHPDKDIDQVCLKKASQLLESRQNRTPIAYLLGFKEFYGRNFQVTPDTLIPRPESETIIDTLNQLDLKKDAKLIDIGTGSGCLGISAKLEKPEFCVTLSDISPAAIEIAKSNAKKLRANVEIIQNDLLKGMDDKFDIIIANLPYVDKSWQRSPETNYEPALALFAENNGKDLINKLIIQSTNNISDGGYLIIEADPEQHDDLVRLSLEKLYKLFIQKDYILAFRYSN